MLKFITTAYNEKNMRYTFRGFFGVGFRNFIERTVITKNKSNYLFVRLSNTEIVIDSFFLLELKVMLEKIIKGEYINTTYVNMGSLKNLLKEIEDKTWLREKPINNFKINRELIESKFAIDLLDYQVKLFSDYEYKKNFLDQRGLLLHADTGSGKTLMGLTLSIGCERDIKLFIVPKKALETVWVRSILTDPDNYFKEKITKDNVYTSLDLEKNEYNGQEFIIWHDDALDKLIDMLDKVKGKTISITVDEAHRFTTSDIKRRQLLLEVIKKTESQDIFMLSATPIRASSLEVMLYLEILDKKYTDLVNVRYGKLYAKPTKLLLDIGQVRFGNLSVKITIEKQPITYQSFLIKIPNGNDYTLTSVKNKMLAYSKARFEEIYKNIDKYKKRYDELISKVKRNTSIKTEQWDEYHNGFEKVIVLAKRGLLIENYELVKRVNKFEKEHILPILSKEEKIDFKDASVILKYPKFKVSGEVLGRVFMKMWMECHREMAKHLDYSFIDNALGKTIIAASHIETIEAANDKLIKDGFKPITVYGKESKNASAIVTKFMDDPNANPLTGTYDNIGESHHLVVANTVLSLNFPFRTYRFEQFVNRVNRLGQKNPINAFYTLLDTSGEYNINSRNVDILKWCKSVVEEITGHYIPNLDIEDAIVTSIDVTENNFIEDAFLTFEGRISESYDNDLNQNIVNNNFKVDEPDKIVSNDKIFNRSEYLDYALKEDLLADIQWYQELFGVVEKDGKYKYTEVSNGNKYVLMYGVKFRVTKGIKSPIIKDTDVVYAKKEHLSCLSKDTYTSAGLLIANYLFVEKPFKNKMGFKNREFSHDEICNLLPDLLNKEVVTIEEYQKYVNSISMSLGLNNLFVINATKSMLMSAPGMKKFKKDLKAEYDKKYGTNWVDNDVTALKFIGELIKFDNTFIKNDPSYGKLLSGKILNNSRPREFISFGVENGFGSNDAPTFIINSLTEGYPKNKKMLAAMYNSARSGSFDRGYGTQEAGYMVKQMQKAVNSLVILDGDCGDTVGDEIIVLERDLWLYKNIYVIENGKPIFKENLDEYLGKKIKVRSALTCKNDGSLCEVCVGRDAARYKKGVPLMVIAAIGVLLGIKMKSMHKASKELIEFNILDTIV